jgi:hypothetical protein
MFTWKSSLVMSMFLLFTTIVTGSYYTFLLLIGWYFIALSDFNEDKAYEKL